MWSTTIVGKLGCQLETSLYVVSDSFGHNLSHPHFVLMEVILLTDADAKEVVGAISSRKS